MAANAQVYQTTTIADASPDFNVVVAIASIGGVAVDPWASIVRVDATVILTTGADTTAVVLQVRRNSITGTQLGNDFTYPVAAGEAYPLNITAVGSEPAGTHNYLICLTQTDASADATVDAVVALATVGN